MLAHDSVLIQRHKNPIGIFARAIIYPLIGVGLWQHNVLLVLIGGSLEILNWTVMPPVKTTFRFIEDAVAVELAWLHARRSPLKMLSLVVLSAFPVVLGLGLWLHSLTLLAGAVLLILCFYMLMRRLGSSPRTANNVNERQEVP